jgi:molybdopterin synthase sulfur carrier subunit
MGPRKATDEFSTGRSSNNLRMTTDTGTAVLCLHGPLRKLAGGQAEHRLRGATVIELIRALEAAHPELEGWILDEPGRIRRHINVFVAGELGAEETAVGPGDRVEVLPAITGGSR